MKLRNALPILGLNLVLSSTGLAHSEPTGPASTDTVSKTDCPQIGVPDVQYAGKPVSAPLFDDSSEVPLATPIWERMLPSSNLPARPAECVHSGYSDEEGDVWEYKIGLGK